MADAIEAVSRVVDSGQASVAGVVERASVAASTIATPEVGATIAADLVMDIVDALDLDIDLLATPGVRAWRQ